MGLFDIFKKKSNSDEYDSIYEDNYSDETPGWDPYAYPECPNCGTKMGYSYIKDEFKCYKCGYLMDGCDSGTLKSIGDNGMPWACSCCGGPWPDCANSCKLYDD